jgi:hypothetical protein
LAILKGPLVVLHGDEAGGAVGVDGFMRLDLKCVSVVVDGGRVVALFELLVAEFLLLVRFFTIRFFH